AGQPSPTPDRTIAVERPMIVLGYRGRPAAVASDRPRAASALERFGRLHRPLGQTDGVDRLAELEEAGARTGPLELVDRLDGGDVDLDGGDAAEEQGLVEV